MYDSGDSKGKPYVLLMGVAKTPEEHDGVRVAGQLVGPFMFPMCDTPKRTIGLQKLPGSFRNWYGWMLDHVGRLLGVKSMESVPFEQVDGILDHLQKEKPHFNFSTNKGKDRQDPKDPKKTIEGGVFTNLLGRCEYNGQVDVEASVSSDETDGQAGSEGSGPAVDEPSGSEGQEALADLSVEELLGKADQEGEEAKLYQERLLEIAAELDIEGAAEMETWNHVVEAITAARTAGDDDQEQPDEVQEEPEEWKPKKGDVVKWKPTDPKGKPLIDKMTKKPVKAIEVEIVSVNEKTGMVTLKNNTTKKPVVAADKLPQKVAWSDLIHD
jgi:hypothetical protein